uniref:Uncharacterized protein n=1 Tax=Oryza brachyantha TaxID=4533 RepID=J3LWK1_ORYBR
SLSLSCLSLLSSPLPAAVFSPSSLLLCSSSPHIVRVLAGAAAATHAVRCAAAKDSILHALEYDEIFNSAEVIQWESGKSINSIAVAQGIRIRRRCLLRYPSEGSSTDKAVSRNILEQIIWDKEVEVSQVKFYPMMAAAVSDGGGDEVLAWAKEKRPSGLAFSARPSVFRHGGNQGRRGAEIAGLKKPYRLFIKTFRKIANPSPHQLVSDL